MLKSDQKVYKFHFKMDAKMYSELGNNPLYQKAGNISKLINKILSMLCPEMEKQHLQGEQMLSQYQLVHEDMEVERKNVFVYLPDFRYRKLKLSLYISSAPGPQLLYTLDLYNW